MKWFWFSSGSWYSSKDSISLISLELSSAGVNILQKYEFYSPAPPRRVKFFSPRFFLKSAKKGPEKIKTYGRPPS